jgi:uncharacterized membrane protein YedE/YeeE
MTRQPQSTTSHVNGPLRTTARGLGPTAALLYIAAGAMLGIVFVKSEVLSWYRIQEMFRFQSVHMFGVIGSALAVASLSLSLLRRFKIRTLDGQAISVPAKQMTPAGARYWMGGTLFGLGWALLGACPGPMFALLGAGVTSMSLAILSAMAGTWAYAALEARLPH